MSDRGVGQGLPSEFAEEVLDLVASIPEGRVLSYGDVAEMLGGRGARTVGTVMSRFGSDLPWWRVVRADGRPAAGLEDRALAHLREEATPLVGGGLTGRRVHMPQARWPGP